MGSLYYLKIKGFSKYIYTSWMYFSPSLSLSIYIYTHTHTKPFYLHIYLKKAGHYHPFDGPAALFLMPVSLSHFQEETLLIIIIFFHSLAFLYNFNTWVYTIQTIPVLVVITKNWISTQIFIKKEIISFSQFIQMQNKHD